MFDFKIISILTVIIFLFVGCEESTKVKDSKSSSKRNTLNDSDLGHETGSIRDYFYNNFDEEIDAQYLYYSEPYYPGASSTISKPKRRP